MTDLGTSGVHGFLRLIREKLDEARLAVLLAEDRERHARWIAPGGHFDPESVAETDDEE